MKNDVNLINPIFYCIDFDFSVPRVNWLGTHLTVTCEFRYIKKLKKHIYREQLFTSPVRTKYACGYREVNIVHFHIYMGKIKKGGEKKKLRLHSVSHVFFNNH